jgi:hypothetical protein
MTIPVLVAALLMTVSPVFAQPAAPSPQTFVLTPDGTCSLKSSRLNVQFEALAKNKNVITAYDIRWQAIWETTGCKLPLFVVATFDYVNDRNQVFQSAQSWTKVKRERPWTVQEKLEGLPTSTVAKIRSVKLSKLQAVTEEQYNASKQKP